MDGNPINFVRRRDRAVEDDEWIREFLERSPYGVVATERDHQPFMNPVVYAYDADTHSIYFHTSRHGQIFANIEQNSRVCFCASEVGEFVPATSASGLGVEYQSVVVFGRACVIDDDAEAERALRMLIEKHFSGPRFGAECMPISTETVRQTAVYRFQVESWSGKRRL